MTDNEKKSLINQLRAQADALESCENEKVTLGIVSTCGALLRVCNRTNCLQYTETADTDSLYAHYIGICTEVENFFTSYVNCLQAERDTSHHQNVLNRLNCARQEVHAMRSELLDSQAESMRLKEQVEQMRSELKQAAQELESCKAEHQALRDELSAYCPEIIEAGRQTNIKLATQLEEARTLLKEILAEQQRLKNDLEAVNSEIASAPASSKCLADAYLRKLEELELLRNAAVSCSEEKQDELRQQIEALRPVVEKNKEAVDVLGNRLADLSQQNTIYIEARDSLSTNIFALLNEAMADLESKLVKREAALAEVKGKADEFEKRLAACEQIRQSYSSWFEVSATPLDALINSVGRAEAQQLRQTLDPACISRVSQLKSETEERLNELDVILKKCIQAVDADQKKLNRRARI